MSMAKRSRKEREKSHKDEHKEHSHFHASHTHVIEKQIFKWKMLSFVFLFCFMASFVWNISVLASHSSSQKIVTTTLPASTQAIKCSDADAKRVINFINKYLVQPGTNASLVNYTGESVCNIMTKYRGVYIPVLLYNKTKLLLLGNAIDMVQVEKRAKMIEEMQKKSMENVTKTKTPDVKLFIMSFCPFGRAAAKSMEPVYRLLKTKANITVHYVIYPSSWYKGREEDYCLGKYCSMHGVEELKEDVREMCIAKIYGWDKFWDYMKIELNKCNLGNIALCWKDVAKQVGIDVRKIEKCFNESAEKMLEKEYQLNKKYGVTGSPTLIINNVEYRGPRTPEAFKNAICKAFIEVPGECNKTITVNSSSGTTTGACG